MNYDYYFTSKDYKRRCITYVYIILANPNLIISIPSKYLNDSCKCVNDSCKCVNDSCKYVMTAASTSVNQRTSEYVNDSCKYKRRS